MNMSRKIRSASDALLQQSMTIALAISRLQRDLDAMHDSTNPDEATWQDVAKFAHSADIARHTLDYYAD